MAIKVEQFDIKGIKYDINNFGYFGRDQLQRFLELQPLSALNPSGEGKLEDVAFSGCAMQGEHDFVLLDLFPSKPAAYEKSQALADSDKVVVNSETLTADAVEKVTFIYSPFEKVKYAYFYRPQEG